VGSATVTIASSTFAFTAAGNYAGTTVALTLDNPEFQPMNVTGNHAANSITGTVNGSGFQNEPVTLTRQ